MAYTKVKSFKIHAEYEPFSMPSLVMAFASLTTNGISNGNKREEEITFSLFPASNVLYVSFYSLAGTR